MPRGTLSCEETLKVCWINMRQRCYNKNQPSYHHYGGRGILICRAWQDDFESFYNDMADSWERGLEIERRDNEQGYSPDNCYWATHKANLHNRREGWNRTISPEMRQIVSVKLKAAWARGCYANVKDRGVRISEGLKKYYARRKAEGKPAMDQEICDKISAKIKASWLNGRKDHKNETHHNEC